MLKITVVPVREPINHVLITATDTAQRRCRMNGYPALRLGADQQAPTAPMAATKPATPVVLAPGASAYAGLTTSAADGSGRHGRNEPTIELQLLTGEGGSDPKAAPVKLAMPKDSAYVDDSASVTYWVGDQQTALP